MINWKIETRKLSDLKPYPQNPRKKTELGVKQLEKSIDQIGLASVPNITQDNIILSGHQRIALLTKKFGPAHVIDVYVADRALTPQEMQDVVIWLNKAIAGTWDTEFIEEKFEELGFAKYGFGEEKKEKRTPNKFCPKCGHNLA